ncbi:hypothetical protein P3X46_009070, partial [Hevea brasiliensis]
LLFCIFTSFTSTWRESFSFSHYSSCSSNPILSALVSSLSLFTFLLSFCCWSSNCFICSCSCEFSVFAFCSESSRRLSASSNRMFWQGLLSSNSVVECSRFLSALHLR